MEQSSYVEIIKDQTERALWEVQNIIDCIPDNYWTKRFRQILHLRNISDLFEQKL